MEKNLDVTERTDLSEKLQKICWASNGQGKCLEWTMVYLNLNLIITAIWKSFGDHHEIMK
jgi:hypothetical protein